MMHEARIVLPEADNSGIQLPSIHAALERELCERFGGCTVTRASGLWRHPDTGQVVRDRVVTYDVAIDRADAPKVRAIAVEFGRRARQDAVYFRSPTGMVQIIGLAVDQVAAEA